MNKNKTNNNSLKNLIPFYPLERSKIPDLERTNRNRAEKSCPSRASSSCGRLDWMTYPRKFSVWSNSTTSQRPTWNIWNRFASVEPSIPGNLRTFDLSSRINQLPTHGCFSTRHNCLLCSMSGDPDIYFRQPLLLKSWMTGPDGGSNGRQLHDLI